MAGPPSFWDDPVIVFAHAGHWLVSLAYLAPLLFLVGVILVGKIRDRRTGSRDPNE